MSKDHGARQQKKLAKQKAKRSEKRSSLIRRTSSDPTVRLERAEKWPVVQSLVGAELWTNGMASLVIAREESEGRLIFAVYLVDAYCLGVKDAFWRSGSPGDLKDLIRNIERTQTMRPIEPACLVKIVQGAVEYAQSFGLPPHPDFRHAAMLLAGIDPGTCPREFAFGRDGKPYYIQGPHDSPARVAAIMQRITEADGHFLIPVPGSRPAELAGIEDAGDELDDDDPPELRSPLS